MYNALKKRLLWLLKEVYLYKEQVFLKASETSGLLERKGAVAIAVGIFSGCSIHFLKGISCVFKTSANFSKDPSFFVYHHQVNCFSFFDPLESF